MVNAPLINAPAWPGVPGVPLNPERHGWHWLLWEGQHVNGSPEAELRVLEEAAIMAERILRAELARRRGR